MELNIEGQKKEVGQESTSVLSGREIESIRKRLGSTQKEVAEQIGITASMVSKIERGLANPSPEVASKLKKWAEEAHERLLLDKPKVKRCWKCKDVLSVSAFGKDKSRKFGLQSKCSSCNVKNVDSWRKSNWNEFLNQRKITRKLNSSDRRLAGHKWIYGDERNLNELLQLAGPDELYVYSTIWTTFSRDDGSTIPLNQISKSDVRKRHDLYNKADCLLAKFGMGDLYEENPIQDFHAKFCLKLKDLFESGKISELQVRRIVRLAVERPQSSFRKPIQ